MTMLTSGFSGFLTPEQTAPIFEKAKETSLVQRLARQQATGPNGISIPTFTGEITAAWVQEGGFKPSSDIGATSKTMIPRKAAGTVVFSNELVRANPLGVLQEVNAQIAQAIAKAFDSAVFYGVDSPFGADLADTTKSVELDPADIYGSVNNVLRLLLADRKELTGWAIDQSVEADFNVATTTGGASIFVEDATQANRVVRSGRLLGREAYLGRVANADGSILGFAGDWSQIIWGQVGGISVRSDSTGAATWGGELRSLLEHNMTAIVFEAELAVLINDLASFVKLTPKAATGG